MPDIPEQRGLVTRAAAADHPRTAGTRARADDDACVIETADQARIRTQVAVEHLVDDVGRLVNELHAVRHRWAVLPGELVSGPADDLLVLLLGLAEAQARSPEPVLAALVPVVDQHQDAEQQPAAINRGGPF